jgi:RNA polymerase sigma-70 factor (ECF subfamily)
MSIDAIDLDSAPHDWRHADDRTLAAAVAAGERDAFVCLMRRYNQRLFRLARATLRNDADAQDALQEAYLAAYRSIGAFRGDAQLSTWLSRLVLNACFARLRREGRRRAAAPMVSLSANDGSDLEYMDSSEGTSPDDALMRSQLRVLLERKLDALPEVFRVVFVMRCVEELSVEETAQCLGIPEATVRTRHFRARSLLRESLAQELDLAERDVFSFDGARCDRIVAGVLERLEGAVSDAQ